jgi:hypothetical protein
MYSAADGDAVPLPTRHQWYPLPAQRQVPRLVLCSIRAVRGCLLRPVVCSPAQLWRDVGNDLDLSLLTGWTTPISTSTSIPTAPLPDHCSQLATSPLTCCAASPSATPTPPPGPLVGNSIRGGVRARRAWDRTTTHNRPLNTSTLLDSAHWTSTLATRSCSTSPFPSRSLHPWIAHASSAPRASPSPHRISGLPRPTRRCSPSLLTFPPETTTAIPRATEPATRLWRERIRPDRFAPARSQQNLHCRVILHYHASDSCPAMEQQPSS